MNDDLTTRLTRQLHDQVDDWSAHPLTLEGVQGRARSIHRRRQVIAGAAVAAAVLAVAVPVGAALSTNTGSTDVPVAPAPTRVVDSENPATQSALAIPYLEGRTLALTDGARVELPAAYQSGTVLGGTVFGLRTDDGGNLLMDVVDGAQQVTETVTLTYVPVSNGEASAFAYLTGGDLVVRWETGQVTLATDVPEGLNPVAFAGGPDCTEGTSECSVYLRDELGGPSRVVTNTGTDQDVPGDFETFVDATEDGRYAVITRVKDELGAETGACSGVLVPPATTAAWESCDHSALAFSPDGAHLSASQSYQDGFGDGIAAILDSETGDEVARYDAPTGGITRSTWEDDEHLLVTDWNNGEWEVIRLATDGTTETALEPVKAGQLRPAYVLLGGF